MIEVKRGKMKVKIIEKVGDQPFPNYFWKAPLGMLNALMSLDLKFVLVVLILILKNWEYVIIRDSVYYYNI